MTSHLPPVDSETMLYLLPLKSCSFCSCRKAKAAVIDSRRSQYNHYTQSHYSSLKQLIAFKSDMINRWRRMPRTLQYIGLRRIQAWNYGGVSKGLAVLKIQVNAIVFASYSWLPLRSCIICDSRWLYTTIVFFRLVSNTCRLQALITPILPLEAILCMLVRE